jgi:hypothetical protein
MTGPEHYQEAERLLVGAQNVMDIAPVDGLTREGMRRLGAGARDVGLSSSGRTGGLPAEAGDRLTTPSPTGPGPSRGATRR